MPRCRPWWIGTAEAQYHHINPRARLRRPALVSTGIVSCAASRALAEGYLRRAENRELFGTLLAARFSEVIVDEAQDCSPAELSVLEFLKEHGVRTICIADLDQSIFEFRDAVGQSPRRTRTESAGPTAKSRHAARAACRSSSSVVTIWLTALALSPGDRRATSTMV